MTGTWLSWLPAYWLAIAASMGSLTLTIWLSLRA
jgi:hypothetical protein